MSIAPLDCETCRRQRVFDGVGPVTPETAYGVAWVCPQCHTRSLDVCALGPVIPSAAACLNCGADYAQGAAGQSCDLCGLTRSECTSFLGITTMPTDVAAATQHAFSQGLYRHGLALLNQALVLNGQLADAWRLKCSFLQAIGFHESHAQALRHMMTIGIPWAAISYGALLHSRGRFADAVAVYEQFLEKHASGQWTTAAMGNLANSLSALGRTTDAERIYHEVLGREPQRASHYANFALLLIEQRRWEEALQMIDRSLATTADQSLEARFWENKSFVLAELDRGPEALAAIERATALGADTVSSHYLHGRALGLVGRLAEAKTEIEWVLQKDPDNPDARRAIVKLEEALNSRPWWKLW